MKRAGDLWTALTSWENLLECVRLAARGKRRRSPAVTRFLHEMEGNLCRLQRELREGSYRPGAYRTFRIYDPKRTGRGGPAPTGEELAPSCRAEASPLCAVH